MFFELLSQAGGNQVTYASNDALGVVEISTLAPRTVQLSHKITEWLELEGTSRIMDLQPPCHRQGHQSPHLILDRAAQGPIQPGLKHLQGWGIHNLSGQLVPVPHHSHSKELPSDIQLKSSLLYVIEHLDC